MTDEKEIKRYDFVDSGAEAFYEDRTPKAIEYLDGEYVKFVDHKSEVDRLNALIQEQQETIQETIKELEDYRVMWGYH